MDELDDVADDTYGDCQWLRDGTPGMRTLTHDQEADSDCLRDPDELLFVGLWGSCQRDDKVNTCGEAYWCSGS